LDFVIYQYYTYSTTPLVIEETFSGS